MDGKTMDQLKAMLMERRRKIEPHLERVNGDEAIPQSEMIDMAQALEQLGRDQTLLEQERRELRAVDRALTKLAAGDFGSCEDCGDEIPPRRLMALPEARFCANCQAFAERQSMRMRAVGA